MATEKELQEQKLAELEAAKKESQKDYEAKLDALKRDHEEKLKTAELEAKDAQARKDEMAERISLLEKDVESEKGKRFTEANQAWIDKMAADGKLAPVEIPRVRAFLQSLPKEQVLKDYKDTDGKEVKESMLDAFKNTYEKRASIFQEVSRHETEDASAPLDDAGSELSRLAEKEMKADKDLNMKDAFMKVQNANPALYQKYNSQRKQ